MSVASLARRLERRLGADAELATLGIPPERRCFLPNGVDTGRFERAGERERAELRGRLGLSAGPLVVYSGRLVPEKRIEDLLVAWRDLGALHAHAGDLEGAGTGRAAPLEGTGVESAVVSNVP